MNFGFNNTATEVRIMTKIFKTQVENFSIYIYIKIYTLHIYIERERKKFTCVLNVLVIIRTSVAVLLNPKFMYDQCGLVFFKS